MALPDAPSVQENLDRILRSDIFSRSERARALLFHLVQMQLSGESSRLKGAVIAVEMFQKDVADTESSRDRPQEGLRNVSITGYGISGAYEVRPDLNVGATLGIYTMHIDSQFRRFATLGGFDGPPDFSRVLGIGTQVGDDVAVAPTIGAIWRRQPADPQQQDGRFWSIGAVYRRGPTLTFETTVSDDERRCAVHGPTSVRLTWTLACPRQDSNLRRTV